MPPRLPTLQAQQREEQRRAKAAAAAAKAQEKVELKALKQAQCKARALQQVRLLVDASLLTPGSPGVGLLGEQRAPRSLIAAKRHAAAKGGQRNAQRSTACRRRLGMQRSKRNGTPAASAWPRYVLLPGSGHALHCGPFPAPPSPAQLHCQPLPAPSPLLLQHTWTSITAAMRRATSASPTRWPHWTWPPTRRCAGSTAAWWPPRGPAARRHWARSSRARSRRAASRRRAARRAAAADGWRSSGRTSRT